MRHPEDDGGCDADGGHEGVGASVVAGVDRCQSFRVLGFRGQAGFGDSIRIRHSGTLGVACRHTPIGSCPMVRSLK